MGCYLSTKHFTRETGARSEFGVRMVKARKRAGMTQVRAVDYLRLNSKATLSQYETGSRMPSLPAVAHFSRKYSVSVAWLMGESDLMIEPKTRLGQLNVDAFNNAVLILKQAIASVQNFVEV